MHGVCEMCGTHGPSRPRRNAVVPQAEDDTDAPQATMSRGTISEEVAKPAANHVEVGRRGCSSSVHVFGMLRSDLDARGVGHRLDREEPPQGRSSLCRRACRQRAVP